jgi:transcriptional regulator with XRE-family HTH domain
MAKQIAANARRLLRERGWNQQQLAEKVGISRSAINQIMTGKVDPAFSTVQAMADELGVSVGELAGERATGGGLSNDGRKIAEWYDSLGFHERAFANEMFRRIFGFRVGS